MEIAMLVLTVLGVVAAIIAALPPLGFDVRLFGRPNMPLEGIPYFRARQAWVAIVVAVISLGVSAGAFYYFFRPRIIEHTVEKTVEKLVPIPCPEQKATPVSGAKPIKKNSNADANPAKDSQPLPTVINAPGGIPIVDNKGTVNNPTVNNFDTPLPNVQWHGEPLAPRSNASNLDPDRYPGMMVHMQIDGSFRDASFVAKCDRPCVSVMGTLSGQYSGATMPQSGFANNNNQYLPAIHFEMPNTLPKGEVIDWEIRSQDGAAVTVVQVVPYKR
jgi:hypothetical protein